MLKNRFLFLTYDPDQIQDGIGAQTQRIWKINMISKKYKASYLHTPVVNINQEIVDISKTSRLESEKILKLYNERYSISSDKFSAIDLIKKYRYLSRRDLLINHILSIASRKYIILEIVDSFNIRFTQTSRRYKNKIQKNCNQTQEIAVHVRNALPIYGKKDWRNLEFGYYLDLLHALETKLKSSGVNYRINIFTDYPRTSRRVLLATAKKSDVSLAFLTSEQANEGYVFFEGFNIKKLYFKDQDNVRVFHGGNPIEILEKMSSSDYLILSRSSFSSIAGILNGANHGGVVITPPNFLYLKDSSWHKSSRYIKIKSEWKLSFIERLMRNLIVQIIVKQIIFVRRFIQFPQIIRLSKNAEK
jgi:hypothetical protein